MKVNKKPDSDYFSGSSCNKLDESENAYDVPEPRTAENEYQIPTPMITTSSTTTTTTTTMLTTSRRVKEKSESLKNLTVVSAASSVRSSVVQCCLIKPLKFFSSKNVKKCLKKI